MKRRIISSHYYSFIFLLAAQQLGLMLVWVLLLLSGDFCFLAMVSPFTLALRFVLMDLPYILTYFIIIEHCGMNKKLTIRGCSVDESGTKMQQI